MKSYNSLQKQNNEEILKIFESATCRPELLKNICSSIARAYQLTETWMVMISDATGDLLVTQARNKSDNCVVRLLMKDASFLPECCRQAIKTGKSWQGDNTDQICVDCKIKANEKLRTYVNARSIDHDTTVFLGIHMPIESRIKEDDRTCLDQLTEEVFDGFMEYVQRETALPGQLSESDRYSAFFRNMSDGVMILEYDHHGLRYVIKDINAAGGRIARVCSADVIGADVLEVFPGLIDCSLFEMLSRVSETGNAEGLKEYVYSDDRISFFGKSYISRLESGEVVVIFEDISEQVQARKKQAKEIMARKQAERALIDSESKFRTIYEFFPVGIARVSLDFKILEANPSYCDMLGYTEEELVGKSIYSIAHPDTKNLNWTLQNKLLTCETKNYILEKRFIHKNGKIVHGLLHATLVSDMEGNPSYFLGCVLDISERIQLENRLYQLQKLDSIGRLAAGVSHDFNNLISPIMGYAQLLVEDLPEHSPQKSFAQEIHNAGARARELTRQLQAFGRKQNLSLQVMEINGVIRSFQNLLRRLIRENIKLNLDLFHEPINIKGDIGQVEQILMNLIVNARDAISGAGTITVRTSVVNLDSDSLELPQNMASGCYAKLQVVDDGVGIDGTILDQVFEPFFTTKAAGKGTGLGLSTVFGIVNQHHGFVYLASEPDKGTVANVILPIRHSAGDEENTLLIPEQETRTQKKTLSILVVEDDTQVRRLTENLLIRMGYRVISASSGKEAINLVESAVDDPIDLLLTDVIMPDMNGKVTYENLKSRIPHLKVIFMSGYTGDVISQYGVLSNTTHFIQKPFSTTSLQKLIQHVAGLD